MEGDQLVGKVPSGKVMLVGGPVGGPVGGATDSK